MLLAIVGVACFAIVLAAYFAPAYWAARDAYRRGRPPGTIVLLWWLLGPLSAIIWLAIRPSTTLVRRPVAEFATSDDAIVRRHALRSDRRVGRCHPHLRTCGS